MWFISDRLSSIHSYDCCSRQEYYGIMLMGSWLIGLSHLLLTFLKCLVLSCMHGCGRSHASHDSWKIEFIFFLGIIGQNNSLTEVGLLGFVIRYKAFLWPWWFLYVWTCPCVGSRMGIFSAIADVFLSACDIVCYWSGSWFQSLKEMAICRRMIQSASLLL